MTRSAKPRIVIFTNLDRLWLLRTFRSTARAGVAIWELERVSEKIGEFPTRSIGGSMFKCRSYWHADRAQEATKQCTG
jgi:hypothetical protein